MNRFASRKPMSAEDRAWLKDLIKKLGKNQSAIARECGVKIPWFSMILTGRTSRQTPEMLRSVQQGLGRLISSYTGSDRNELLAELEQRFSRLTKEGDAPARTSSEDLVIAGEILQILEQRCPDLQRRRQVIALLEFVVR